MSDKELNDLIKQVTKCKDMDLAEELYDEILLMPELITYKDDNFIAELKYRRAINLEIIAEWYMYESPKPLPIRAHTSLKIAHQETTAASILYDKPKQKLKADTYATKLHAKLERIESIIESNCAIIPELIQQPSTVNTALQNEEDQPTRKKTKLGENPCIFLSGSNSSETLSSLSDPNSPKTMEFGNAMK